MADDRSGAGEKSRDTTAQDKTSESSGVNRIAIALSVAALVASIVNIALYYDLQRQANRISQTSISVQKSIQAQADEAAERDRASEVSVEEEPSKNPAEDDVIVENGSKSSIGNVTVVFIRRLAWGDDPSALISLSTIASCTAEVIPPSARVGLKTFNLPMVFTSASLYFTDPDGNYWTTDESGLLSAVAKNIEPPNLPYPAPNDDLTDPFAYATSTYHIPGC